MIFPSPFPTGNEIASVAQAEDNMLLIEITVSGDGEYNGLNHNFVNYTD